jgi:hypothetical protein
MNWLVSPIFWELTHLPILCDMLATSLLILTLHQTRKLGAPSFMGLVATLLNFVLRPTASHFLGFTVASIFFDIASYFIGYDRLLTGNIQGTILSLLLAFLSSGIAGLIIGSFFMNPGLLSTMFGGVILFAIIHAMGGLVGGVLGLIFIRGIESRGIAGAQ